MKAPENPLLLSDPASFETIFRQWYKPLCRTVFRMVNDRELTEDLVQEVFVKMWNRREELELKVSAKAYLYRAAINAAINHIEASKKFVRQEEETWMQVEGTSRTDGDLSLKEVEVHIEEALQALPPACRSVFILSRYDELSYKEIADSLNISVKTVENQMSKALRILREKLQTYLKDAILLCIIGIFLL